MEFKKQKKAKKFNKEKKFNNFKSKDKSYQTSSAQDNEILSDEEGIKKRGVENMTVSSDPYLSKVSENKSDKTILRGFKKYNLLPQIHDSIAKMGYKQPTPIQKKTIPEILNGFNVIVKSRTGSGKSASFILPILQKLSTHSVTVGTRVVVLSPTRELAKQTLSFFLRLSKGMNLKYAVLTGGDKIESQFERLVANPDVIISTPGRLAQHLEEGSISLKKVDILVIDESDKLFEQGFEEQIKQILKSCPGKKQVCLFSATIPDSLANFMKTGIQEYKYISLDHETSIPDSIKLHCVYCRSEEKKLNLISVLKYSVDLNKEKTLIFVPTKHHCEFFVEYLNCFGIPSISIHGKMDQSLRDTNLGLFRKNASNILIVTDLAARGLDIPKLENVINYDFPDNPKLFIHRIGRTGRADSQGKVISLVSMMDLPYLVETKKFISKELSFESTQENEMDNRLISFGVLQDGICKDLSSYFKENLDKLDEDLELSITNAMKKKNAFKLKPKPSSFKESKEIGKRKFENSQLFQSINSSDNDNSNDNGDMSLASLLKGYKPKKTIFQHNNSNTNIVFEGQKRKEENKEEKEDEDKDEWNIGNNDSKDKKLRDAILNQKGSSSLNTGKEELLVKKRKRSQMKNFRNNSQFISQEKDRELSAKLWGNEEPINLNELTLNICPDDDIGKSKNTKYAWNEVTKKFVSGNTDSKGNLVKKNESGKKVKLSDKKVSTFKKWRSQNKDKIRNIGEMEKGKSFGSSVSKEKFKGAKSEVKSFDQLVKEKKDMGKKKYKFAGQVRRSKENQIKEKSHMNRKSMALVRKSTTGKGKKSFEGKNKMKGKKGRR